MQTGPENTHLAGEACTAGACPPEENSRFWEGFPIAGVIIVIIIAATI